MFPLFSLSSTGAGLFGDCESKGVIVELFANFLESHLVLRVLGTDELVPCDLWTNEDLQRRHLAGGVQLGLVPRLVLIHVRLPYWKTQPCLFFSLGWFWVHNALVRHHAAYTSHGIVLLTQLEPRYVPIHRRFYDKTACESSRSLVQENVQSSFLILGFRLPRSYSDTILSKSRKISRQLSVNDAAHTLTRSAQMCHAPFSPLNIGGVTLSARFSWNFAETHLSQREHALE